jgi:hypothetical protein
MQLLSPGTLSICAFVGAVTKRNKASMDKSVRIGILIFIIVNVHDKFLEIP